MSSQFIKDILSGKKALLKLSEIKFVENVIKIIIYIILKVPFWEEFNT